MFSSQRNRHLLVVFLDLFLICESYLLAKFLESDLSIAAFNNEYLVPSFIIVVASQLLVFLCSNMYRSIWKYASLHDMVEILKTVTIASIVSGLALLFFRPESQLPRVILLLDWGLLIIQIGASRLCWRLYREKHYLAGHLNHSANINKSAALTLVVGAGDAANMLLRELLKQESSPYQIVGLIDDDPLKMGMRILGYQVLGTTAQLTALLNKEKIEKVIIAVPSAGSRFIRALVRQCQESGVRFKIIPGLSEIISGDVSVTHLRDVEIDDLLGRNPVRLDNVAISGYLQGRRVLVSGAAGSIGSEICRQVGRYAPAMLVLLDSAETPLFFIERELATLFPNMRIVPLLCDVRNLERLENIFDELMPEVVFHAAAYKHVPMVEHNPVEGVLCNVLGSMNLATVSEQYGAHNFVMISTDKAVNPTNIMGATKRIAEKFIQSLAAGSRTKFSTVRFGNVLGSNGSVIPIFSEQIRAGGPITITHPEITRFFMTIPEASQLVLQSACFGTGGEIFVLDMGEPVRIVDLAEELVRLSGLQLYSDIDIVFTGLRPGEKLYEELFFKGENILKTPHEKVFVLKPVPLDYDHFCQRVHSLLHAASENDVVRLLELVAEIVPEYTPTYN